MDRRKFIKTTAAGLALVGTGLLIIQLCHIRFKGVKLQFPMGETLVPSG